MLGSSLRSAGRLVAYLALTLPLMPVQALALALDLDLARRLPKAYHRWCCRVFGITIEIHGTLSTARPTLFVVNHLSYLDVTVLSAAIETSFVAKREVAGWPLFGWLAKLQRTVFVDRRARGVAQERDELARHLDRGFNLVLFAEGTSGDGIHIRPFKSSLFSVAERQVAGRELTVQPVSLAYTHLDRMPIGRSFRPYFAWYGAMELMPHMWECFGLGRLTATLIFHPPVTITAFASRKALSEHCERAVGHGVSAAHAGRGSLVQQAA